MDYAIVKPFAKTFREDPRKRKLEKSLEEFRVFRFAPKARAKVLRLGLG